MASDAVLKYLIDTNRPYSCADVTVNLRGAYSKTVVQKALEALSDAGTIRCKLYGKQKVYAALQSDDTGDGTEIEDFDDQFKSLTEDLSNKNNELKVAETNLKNLIHAPTTEGAKNQAVGIRKNIETLEKKLETLKNSTEVVSVEEKTTILSEHDKLLREYRKRKRICTDIIDAVLEGYPKSKQNLLEELCIETDEMVNFKIITN